METVRIEIPGVPIAKKRPRFARRGKFVTTYSDQVTEEGLVYLELRRQWGDRPPIEGPVEISFGFAFPVPKSASQKNRRFMLSGSTKHTKKPDTSNLIKFYEDVMNGLAWKDDSQIYTISAKKFYAETAGTAIAIVIL